jgi:hypothetical protein
MNDAFAKLKMNRYEPVAVSALISFAKLANDRAIVNNCQPGWSDAPSATTGTYKIFRPGNGSRLLPRHSGMVLAGIQLASPDPRQNNSGMTALGSVMKATLGMALGSVVNSYAVRSKA